MKIGELAAATGTPVETIRFYEREGLLPEPARTGSNYRRYDAAQVPRVAFIRRCRSLDMALDEIRVLLRFRDRPGEDCGAVDAVLDQHIGHVAERVRELQALESQLRELRARCSAAGSGSECGILETLDRDLPPGAPATPDGAVPAHAHVGPVHGRPGRAAKA